MSVIGFAATDLTQISWPKLQLENIPLGKLVIKSLVLRSTGLKTVTPV